MEYWSQQTLIFCLMSLFFNPNVSFQHHIDVKRQHLVKCHNVTYTECEIITSFDTDIPLPLVLSHRVKQNQHHIDVKNQHLVNYNIIALWYFVGLKFSISPVLEADIKPTLDFDCQPYFHFQPKFYINVFLTLQWHPVTTGMCSFPKLCELTT